MLKLLRGFNEKISEILIICLLLFNIVVKKYKKFIYSLLITLLE